MGKLKLSELKLRGNHSWSGGRKPSESDCFRLLAKPAYPHPGGLLGGQEEEEGKGRGWQKKREKRLAEAEEGLAPISSPPPTPRARSGHTPLVCSPQKRQGGTTLCRAVRNCSQGVAFCIPTMLVPDNNFDLNIAISWVTLLYSVFYLSGSCLEFFCSLLNCSVSTD